MKDIGNIKFNKTFDWDEIVRGDILVVQDEDGVEEYMAITDITGNWSDLMYLTREDCEYMPAGYICNCYSECLKNIYGNESNLKVTLKRKVDMEDAIEFAYDKGFKPIKTMTKEEIESILGHKIRIV